MANELILDTGFNISDEMQELMDEETRDNKKHYRRNLITRIAFLIGVGDEKLENADRFATEELEALRNDEDAMIIRHLCILRTQFFRSYGSIYNERRYNQKRIEELDKYLSIESIEYLRSKGMETAVVYDNVIPAVNVAYINQYIQDNIDKLKDRVIPNYVNFEYLKRLFLIKGGYAGSDGRLLKNDFSRVVNKIVEASKSFSANRNAYPYQQYLTWPGGRSDGDKFILYNDLGFLRLLYAANNDYFSMAKYVIDAKEGDKEDIYKFVRNAGEIEAYVDCENVDPYAFAAALMNLNPEHLAKIKTINLYDDVNASTAWDYISKIVNIPVEHHNVERVLDNKSLVDMSMALDISKEYYENDVDSALLVSSDSDFWAAIEKLDKVRFFVFNEFKKTSKTVIEKLDNNGISHCYLSDFAQDKVQIFKYEVLYLGLDSRVREFNETGYFPINLDELVDELFWEAYIQEEESQLKREKEIFFNKYLKNGLVIKPTNESGVMKFKIELKRK